MLVPFLPWLFYLRYKSSTPTSQGLSSSIFQRLWVRETSVTHHKISTFFIIWRHKALYWPSSTDPVPARINRYRSTQHPVPISTNHCCLILTRHTTKSHHTARLRQLNLVWCSFQLCPNTSLLWFRQILSNEKCNKGVIVFHFPVFQFFSLCFCLPIETATRRILLQMAEQISLTGETDSLYGRTFLELVELK